MINPATCPSDQINAFTNVVVNLFTDNEYGRANCNGTLIHPLFKKAEHETEHDVFFDEDRKYCWNLDGTSVTRPAYDMMEIVTID